MSTKAATIAIACFISMAATNAVLADDEVAALVVDNGSGMCKAGFAGDDATKASSILAQKKATVTANDDGFCGDDDVIRQSAANKPSAQGTNQRVASTTATLNGNASSTASQTATNNKSGT